MNPYHLGNDLLFKIRKTMRRLTQRAVLVQRHMRTFAGPFPPGGTFKDQADLDRTLRRVARRCGER